MPLRWLSLRWALITNNPHSFFCRLASLLAAVWGQAALLCGAVGLIRVDLPPKQISGRNINLYWKHVVTSGRRVHFKLHRRLPGVKVWSKKQNLL